MALDQLQGQGFGFLLLLPVVRDERAIYEDQVLPIFLVKVQDVEALPRSRGCGHVLGRLRDAGPPPPPGVGLILGQFAAGLPPQKK